MIRRISKKNDLKDIIKSCPSGVIDDIYKIEYYIQGYTTTIEATFSKVNKVLEVILPTEDLQTLPNGILMRKAYYKVVDSSYPDGYYNLEFEDNMNIWLGESEGIVPPSPTPGEYVTEEEFVSTLSSYATQSWVSSNQFATQSWVSNKGYLTSVPSSYATKSWVEAQGYITSTGVSGLATQSWVSSNFLSTDALIGYATESWVEAQGYITSTGVSGLATMSWVESQGYITSAALSGYATESWVEYFVENNDQNPCVRAEAFDTFLSYGLQDYGFATQSWVTSQGYLTEVPSEYATQSWVESQGYITSTGLSGLATQSWVLSQGFLTSVPEGYATESWVSSQGYITSTALSDYATKSWATSEFFEESKIWTGTQSEWNLLTPAQQALYTIALVTE